MNLISDQVNIKEIEAIVRELKRTLEKNISGDVVEFGCYLGTTSVYLAKTLMQNVSDRELYVYDSFEGLPEKTKEDFSPLGDCFKTGELLAPKKQFIKNMVQAKVTMPHIKKAWFSDLTDNDIPTKVSFAFLDGDYYLSIADPLKILEDHFSKGATIVVDDYANDALPGAKRAVDEWLKKHDASIRIEQSLAIIYFP